MFSPFVPCWEKCFARFALVVGAGTSSASVMASGDHGRSWYRDDEVVVDNSGIPHYTGAMPELMREYRRRVLFAYTNLEGEGDDPAKEAKDLEKKQCRFAKKLVDALHGEAWRACEELLTEPKLREKDGYKLVFAALQAIEKVGVIKKTEAFDRFFEKCHRSKGQSIDSFLRKRKQDWSNLLDIAEGVNMSDDLMAYFLLKHVNLGKDERRQILLANQSDYTVAGIEKALRVSFFDLHERERKNPQDWNQPRRSKGKGRSSFRSYAVEGEEAVEDEDAEAFEDEEPFDEAYAVEDEPQEDADGELPSDCGASGDEEIFEAFAAMDQHRKTYKESRQKLKQIQRNRGYFQGEFKGEISYEERQKAIQKEKSRTRCAACGRLGHWAGDAACANKAVGPKRVAKPKGGRKGGGKGGKAGRAYMVGEAPLFFSLDGCGDEVEEEAHCNMVHDSEENEMEQDEGFTDTDLRRKQRPPTDVASLSEWETVDEPAQGYAAPSVVAPWIPDSSHGVDPGEVVAEITVTRKVLVKDLTQLVVPSFEEVKPENLEKMKVRELQQECDNWGIQTSGGRGELLERLQKFFRGEMILKKGCTSKFRQLVETSLQPSGASGSGEGPLILPKAKAKSLTPKKVLADPKHGTTPPDRDEESLPDERFFRSWPEESSFRRDMGPRPEPGVAVPKSEAKKDPRTGLVVPSGLAVGSVTALVHCPLCGADMVLRQNSVDAGMFFGCSQFVKDKCRGTRTFADVVSEWPGAPSASGGSRK